MSLPPSAQATRSAEPHPRGIAVDSVWMRGGTSKCWIYRSNQLPDDPEDRDAVLVRLLGSPDPRQIDGVGGATSTTSKVIVVEGVGDTGGVHYVFGQVSVDSPRVEWESNCGNCASALALYAVQEGLVSLRSPRTELLMTNSRTGLVFGAAVDSPDATHPPRDGAESVPGAHYPGVRVVLEWQAPDRVGPLPLPTGNPVDVLDLDGRPVRATLIDAGAPAALLSADDLGIDCAALDLDGVSRLLPLLMSARRLAGERMGLTSSPLQSIPKVGLVGAGPSGGTANVEARMISMTAPHPAIGVTSAIAVAAAATLPGTLVHDVALPSVRQDSFVIGTLIGPVSVGMRRDPDGGPTSIELVRSARRIADARVHLGPEWIDKRRQP